MGHGFLALADWRRRVAQIDVAWRRESTTDPRAAWLRWRQARDELFRDHPPGRTRRRLPSASDDRGPGAAQ